MIFSRWLIFFGAFIAGDTFIDPGGWQAAGLVAAWAVPLAGLAALAWYRSGWVVDVFAVLTAAVIGVSIWFAVNPQGWQSFEDRHGPIRAVITFVLVAAIAVLGLKRTAAAGVLLLVVGIVPLAVSSLGSFLGGACASVRGRPARCSRVDRTRLPATAVPDGWPPARASGCTEPGLQAGSPAA